MWNHYVAIGDSISAGVGDPVRGVEMLGWADRFAAAIQPHHYTNLARPGLTSADIITTQLQPALDLHPDVVTILVGGNDIRRPHFQVESFRANLHTLVLFFVKQGATVITPTIINNRPALPIEERDRRIWLYDRLNVVNHTIREVSRDFGTLCIDLATLPHLSIPALWSSDYIHPNAMGHTLIAAEVIRAFDVRYPMEKVG